VEVICFVQQGRYITHGISTLDQNLGKFFVQLLLLLVSVSVSLASPYCHVYR